MLKPKIGISVGDINGISLEVIIKALSPEKMRELCTPIIYCNSKVVSYHKNIVGADFNFQTIQGADEVYDNRINVINCWQEDVNINLGDITKEGGQYAFESLRSAVIDWRAGRIDALVTAPINKQAMQMAGFAHPGHTEYLASEVGATDHLMLMVSDSMRIGLATSHIPIAQVAGQITKELILRKVRLLHDTLRMDFGLEKPTIAVLGLNPHAGDGGVLGKEDDAIIRPAIIELKKKGMLVMGPYAADGFFGSANFRKFDGILAMYHDQGLIPFKALSFGDGTNYTAGLNCIRTSPDHGTGFDIAGQNLADPSSFRKAIFLAIDVARQRRKYLEMHDNPLHVSVKQASSLETEASEVVEE